MMSKFIPVLAVLSFTSSVSAAVEAYGACGGWEWTGETTCVTGYVCTYASEWYSQCIPGTGPPASTTAVATTSKTTTPVIITITSKSTTPVIISLSTTVSTTLITTTKSTTPVVTTTKSTTTLSTTASASPTPNTSDAIFVAVDGSDSGTGGITSPLKSIQSAVDLATPGKTIYLRAGTYALSKNIQFAKSGTAALPYTVSAYGSEKVILDGEGMVGTPAALNGALANPDRGIFHIQNANYWRFIAIEFINGPYGVYARDASNNYYERLITRNNYESGFQLEGASANNVVLYLDSYGNRDPRKNGESADGFACKSGSGTGNRLIGARLWNNVDDGLDLWDFGSPVTVEDTISWGNGYNRWGFSPFQGDGNGFKLGSKDLRFGAHILKNNIAFLNTMDGFVDNGNTQSITLTRNTAFNNGRQGFRFGSSSSKFVNNVAASNGNAPYLFSSTQTQSGNSWNVGGTWNNGTFVSASSSVLTGPRQADGKVVGSSFLLPASGAAIGATTYWV